MRAVVRGQAQLFDVGRESVQGLEQLRCEEPERSVNAMMG